MGDKAEEIEISVKLVFTLNLFSIQSDEKPNRIDNCLRKKLSTFHVPNFCACLFLLIIANQKIFNLMTFLHLNHHTAHCLILFTS